MRAATEATEEDYPFILIIILWAILSIYPRQSAAYRKRKL
jgi:hypothetical protein